MSISKESVYELVNGDEFFSKLVNIFYDKVAVNEVLNFMFQGKTFDEPKENLFLFLRKIFGGPDEYTPKRGHPMMRRRHMPFPIGLKERNEWMNLMLESLEELSITKDHPAREPMEKYFQNVATHMINKAVSLQDFNT